ncbi:MAG: hypothetical protein EXX96DRAFT_539249 [Benjaminiella poitrasii]|nr:MAG: hypothetical protein EXX96DRAFT_539249 [Benjaminiella poitrasii]
MTQNQYVNIVFVSLILKPQVKCKTCRGTDHRRRTSKQCEFYQNKAETTETDVTEDNSSQFVIKTSLRKLILLPNNIMSQSICSEITKVVEHNRDDSFIMSLFVNYYVMKCVREQRPISKLSHTKFIYPLMSIIIGLGKKQTPLYTMLRTEFNEFVREINDNALPNQPVYRAENFKQTGIHPF